MKKVITLLVFLITASVSFGQYSSIASFNAAADQVTPDSLRPWGGDQGIRGIWTGADLDGDGLQEVIVTDYSNGGRIHMFEINGDVLELVWSSPIVDDSNPNSVPRWARTGDLDGDGNLELIFPSGDRYEGQIEVWEHKGGDNDYGTIPSLVLLHDQLVPDGLLRMRFDRDHATVYDFDGDGKDELITANENNKMYVLGVSGSIGQFATFLIEGGNGASDQQIGIGGWWTSIPADINGDGNLEIVTHRYNNLGFWSAKVTGVDSYEYPDTTVSGTASAYFEFLADENIDGVAYMGLHAVDVDMDNKSEFFGIIYDAGGSDRNYQPFLVDPTDAHDGINGWNVAGFSNIADTLWTLAGKSTGSHWGSAVYDFNGNGVEEFLIGGSADYNLISMEYSGSGDILQPSSYNAEIVYGGAANIFHNVDIKVDSTGTVDTVYSEGPFVSKMFAGSDIDGNGKKEVTLCYQSVADSITYRHQSWDFVLNTFSTDSTWKIYNPNAVNIRILEYTGTTGFVARDLSFVSPDDYVLEQNYPNPFNPTTTINFTLPLDKNISLVVYDVLGKEVKTLLNNEDLKKGSHQVSWDGTNNYNQKVASGNYIYTLKFGNFTKSAKMTLLK